MLVARASMVLLVAGLLMLFPANARKLLGASQQDGDSTGLTIEHASAPAPALQASGTSLEDEKNFMAYGGMGHYSGIGGYVGVGGLPIMPGVGGVGGLGGGIGKVGGLGGGIAKGGAIGGGVGGGVVPHP